MNKLILKVWPFTAFVVDILIIIDVASDLVKKYKNRKHPTTTSNGYSTEAEEAPAAE